MVKWIVTEHSRYNYTEKIFQTRKSAEMYLSNIKGSMWSDVYFIRWEDGKRKYINDSKELSRIRRTSNDYKEMSSNS